MRSRRSPRCTTLVVLSIVSSAAWLAPAVGNAKWFGDHESIGHRESIGQRLGAAVRVLDSDPKEALSVLSDLEPDAERLAAYLGYLRGVAQLGLGQESAAHASFEEVLASFGGSVPAERAAARLARLLAAEGDAERLEELAARYGRRSGDPRDAAQVSLATGIAATDRDPALAAEHLMRARRLAPGTAVGAQAASLLSDLRRQHPSLAPSSAADLLEEARLLGREGDSQMQQKVLDELRAKYPRDTRWIDATLLLSRLVAAREGRIASAGYLERNAAKSARPSTQARLLYAAAVDLWNADQESAASELFGRVLDIVTTGNEAQRSHYALGRIYEANRRFTPAAAEYRRAANGPDGEVASESRWRAGWASYLAGDNEAAATTFGALAARSASDRPTEEAALYWQARSLERAGHADRARAVYSSVLSDHPDGFYALLAEDRTGLLARAPRPVAIEPAEDDLAPAARANLGRAQILAEAGLHDFAREELRRSVADSSDDDRKALLPELARVGAHDHALGTALELYRKGVISEEELYPYLYPHAYAEIVKREAGARGVDAFLVYSLIRQESLFNVRAVSPARAYGLMQLLLSTARRVAAGDGLEQVELEDLFRPEVNIRLGSAYLAELAERFDGDPVLMLAGYNAGEQAAERWRDRMPDTDRDEFIEQISYRETRNYVKKVLRNYRNYQRLYGDTSSAALAEGGQ